MADKGQLLTAFNNHFKEFIDDIQSVFPGDSDIASARKSVGRAIMLMPSLLIKYFNENVASRYRTQIQNGDIDFFINNDYRNDIKSMGFNDESSTLLAKIDCLREPVRNMPPEEQAKVLKYLQNLCKLCDAYIQFNKL